MSPTHAAIGYLVELGIPGAVISALGVAYRAHVKRKALVAAAPEQKIDTSLQRMQKVTIAQDKLIETLQEDLAASRKRERELQARLTEIEQQLEHTRAKLAELTDQLETATKQMADIRAQYPDDDA